MTKTRYSRPVGIDDLDTLRTASTRGRPGPCRFSKSTLRSQLSALALTVGLTGGLTVQPAFAQLSATTLPTGGQVVAGAASIKQSGAALTVTTATNTTAINWNSFSIGQNASVAINQPTASSITVNQVTGVSPSQIFGALKSNGQVVVTNPYGIWFGPSAHVDVAGLVASTASASPGAISDFAKGMALRLDQAGLADASVVNDGHITVASTGLAALVAPGVANNGVIVASLGTVQLGSANTAVVDFYGDGLVHFAVGDQITATPKGPDGKPLKAAVSNKGKLIVPGGHVVMTAGAVKSVVDQAINMSGVIKASNAHSDGGDIVLDGGDAATNVSGKIDASSKTGTGGLVQVTGNSVNVAPTAKIRANGATGGRVQIGGGPRGTGTLAHALSVDVATGAVVTASGNAGVGGNIAVWSDGLTKVAGALTASGKTAGGLIETSGGTLDTTGITVHAGPDGQWLLDPHDLTIDSTLAGAIATELSAGTNVTVTTSSSAAPTVTGTTVPSGDDNASGSGNIIVNSAINWTSSAALTLNAANNIQVNASITSTANSQITLNANSGGGTIAVTNTNGSVTISSAIGNVNFSAATAITAAAGSTISAGSSLTLTDGGSAAYSGTLSGNFVSLTTAAGGLSLASTGSITATNSGISITDSASSGAAATISLLGNVSATSTNGYVSLSTSGIPIALTVGSTISAGGYYGVNLTTGSAGSITLNSGAAVNATASGVGVTLGAGSFSFIGTAAQVSSTTVTINNTSGAAWSPTSTFFTDIGAATATSSVTLNNAISSTYFPITLGNAGFGGALSVNASTITVGGAVTTAGYTTLTAQSGGSLSVSSGASITTGGTGSTLGLYGGSATIQGALSGGYVTLNLSGTGGLSLASSGTIAATYGNIGVTATNSGTTTVSILGGMTANTINGYVSISTNSGPLNLTIGSGIQSGGYYGISLNAGTNGTITFNSSGALAASYSGGAGASLTAASFSFLGSGRQVTASSVSITNTTGSTWTPNATFLTDIGASAATGTVTLANQSGGAYYPITLGTLGFAGGLTVNASTVSVTGALTTSSTVTFNAQSTGAVSVANGASISSSTNGISLTGGTITISGTLSGTYDALTATGAGGLLVDTGASVTATSGGYIDLYATATGGAATPITINGSLTAGSTGNGGQIYEPFYYSNTPVNLTIGSGAQLKAGSSITLSSTIIGAGNWQGTISAPSITIDYGGAAALNVTAALLTLMGAPTASSSFTLTNYVNSTYYPVTLAEAFTYAGQLAVNASTITVAANTIAANNISLDAQNSTNGPVTIQSGVTLSTGITGSISLSGTSIVISGTVTSGSVSLQSSAAAGILIDTGASITAANGYIDLYDYGGSFTPSVTINGSLSAVGGSIYVDDYYYYNDQGTLTIASTANLTANSITLEASSFTLPTSSVINGAYVAIYDGAGTTRSLSATLLTELGAQTATSSFNYYNENNSTYSPIALPDSFAFPGGINIYGSTITLGGTVTAHGNATLSASGALTVSSGASLSVSSGAITMNGTSIALSGLVSASASISLTAASFSLPGSGTVVSAPYVSVYDQAGTAVTLDNTFLTALGGGSATQNFIFENYASGYFPVTLSGTISLPGSLVVYASSINVTGALGIGGSATLNAYSGALTVPAGASVTTGSTSNNTYYSSAALTINGALSGGGATIQGASISIGGTVAGTSVTMETTGTTGLLIDTNASVSATSGAVTIYSYDYNAPNTPVVIKGTVTASNSVSIYDEYYYYYSSSYNDGMDLTVSGAISTAGAYGISINTGSNGSVTLSPGASLTASYTSGSGAAITIGTQTLNASAGITLSARNITVSTEISGSTIGIGGGAGTLQLSTTFMNGLQPPYSSATVTIGDTNSVTTNNLVLSANVHLLGSVTNNASASSITLGGVALGAGGVGALGSGITVEALLDGIVIGSGVTNGSGVWSIAFTPTSGEGSSGSILFLIEGGTSVKGNTLFTGTYSAATNADIWANTLRVVTGQNSLSQVITSLNSTIGSISDSHLLSSTGHLVPSSDAAFYVKSSATTFDVDQSVNLGTSTASFDTATNLQVDGGSFTVGGFSAGAVTMTTGTTINTSATNGAISIGSLNGAFTASLNAGTGTVTLGNTGNTAALTGLTVTGAAVLNGSTYDIVSNAGFNGVSLASSATIAITNSSGSISIASVAGNGFSLTVQGASQVSLGNTAGVASLNVSSGLTTLTGNSYTATAATFGPVSLTGNTSLSTSGTVTLGSVDASGSSGHSLSVSGGSIQIASGAVINADSLTFTGGTSVAFASNATMAAAHGMTLSIGANGTIGAYSTSSAFNLASGVFTSAGQANLGGALSLNGLSATVLNLTADANLTIPGGASNVSFGSLQGNHTLSINGSPPGAPAQTISGDLFANLTNLTGVSGITLDLLVDGHDVGDIVTGSGGSYNFTLPSSIHLATTGSGSSILVFVDNGGKGATFQDNVTQSMSGLAVYMNALVLNTSAASLQQTLINVANSLGNHTIGTFSVTGSGNTTGLTAASGVDLMIAPPSGTVGLGDGTGNYQISQDALGRLTGFDLIDIAAQGTIDMAGTIHTDGGLSLDSAIAMTGDTSITADKGEIVLGAITGQHDLTLNAGGNILFDGDEGTQNARLGHLSVTAGGDARIQINPAIGVTYTLWVTNFDGHVTGTLDVGDHSLETVGDVSIFATAVDGRIASPTSSTVSIVATSSISGNVTGGAVTLRAADITGSTITATRSADVSASQTISTTTIIAPTISANATTSITQSTFIATQTANVTSTGNVTSTTITAPTVSAIIGGNIINTTITATETASVQAGGGLTNTTITAPTQDLGIGGIDLGAGSSILASITPHAQQSSNGNGSSDSSGDDSDSGGGNGGDKKKKKAGSDDKGSDGKAAKKPGATGGFDYASQYVESLTGK